ncbi:hypothetical protein HMPREF1576_00561 [Gardnerella pickettii JCP7719]|uniref:Kinesin motor domain-containing protein n=1 Tax=Gardnerella pickettii JCP7719 TaxID=1261061 RepID=S4H4P3_9BIFI|nr:hypothetical protein HMPREF1576_00561 [Gardnerella pickettii JCP7719]
MRIFTCLFALITQTFAIRTIIAGFAAKSPKIGIFSHLIFAFLSGDMQKMTTFDIVVACSKIKVLVRARPLVQARTQGGESDES